MRSRILDSVSWRAAITGLGRESSRTSLRDCQADSEEGPLLLFQGPRGKGNEPVPPPGPWTPRPPPPSPSTPAPAAHRRCGAGERPLMALHYLPRSAAPATLSPPQPPTATSRQRKPAVRLIEHLAALNRRFRGWGGGLGGSRWQGGRACNAPPPLPLGRKFAALILAPVRGTEDPSPVPIIEGVFSRLPATVSGRRALLTLPGSVDGTMRRWVETTRSPSGVLVLPWEPFPRPAGQG